MRVRHRRAVLRPAHRRWHGPRHPLVAPLSAVIAARVGLSRVGLSFQIQYTLVYCSTLKILHFHFGRFSLLAVCRRWRSDRSIEMLMEAGFHSRWHKHGRKRKLLIDGFVASPPEPLRVSEFQAHLCTRLVTTIESRHHTRIWVLIARVLLASHTFAPYSQAEISSEVV